MSKAQKKPPAKPRQRKANGYKFPDKLPAGEVLTDVKKNEWVLGPSIGKGGFGEIYSAKESSSKGNNYPYVVKIEPHENGPLFVENNFYLRVGKPDDVQDWKTKAGIKILGMPMFHGFGSHDFKSKKYRFLVIERYGKDVWTSFLENNRQFPFETVCRYALQIIDVLEYIHSRGYVHLDIKGANLLLGLKKGSENNVFLVDFGLACKYSTAEFKRDPKKAHNGTIEYTSQDMHMGVPTRRGDMEILGFNLLQWIVSKLPWEGDISYVEKVQAKKEEFMSSVTSYIKKHFPSLPKALISYLEYVSKLKYDQVPDYALCRGLFRKELEKPSSSSTPRRSVIRPSRRSETPVVIDDKVEEETSQKRKRVGGKKKVEVEEEFVEEKIETTRGKRGSWRKVEEEEPLPKEEVIRKGMRGNRRKIEEDSIEKEKPVKEDEVIQKGIRRSRRIAEEESMEEEVSLEEEEVSLEEEEVVPKGTRGDRKKVDKKLLQKKGMRGNRRMVEDNPIEEEESAKKEEIIHKRTRIQTRASIFEEESMEEEMIIQKGKRSEERKIIEAEKVSKEEEEEEDEIIGPTDEEESPAATKRMRGKKNAVGEIMLKNKYTWRDAPAIIASSISKAGEYHRKEVLKTTRKRKVT